MQRPFALPADMERVGHYLIRDCIGQGGMGRIFTAYDERLDRVVVVKAIAPELVHADQARRRFLREARAAAALNHPFICTVHEVLEHEGTPFIVMEYVDGENLRARIGRGALPAAEVRRVGLETAEALTAAHHRGVIHRDVSAGNIMLTSSGHVKVMDFGLAQIGSRSGEHHTEDVTHTSDALTAAGAVVGTPAYLAPELLRGRPADERSDLYSLGVVLYQASTGRLPFSGPTVPVVMSEILNATPPTPRSLRDDMPAALERIILRLMAKNRDDRYAGAAEAASELRAASDSAAAPARPAPRSIAVLPFKDLAQDPANAHVGLGLADATITELAGIKALLVRPTAAMMRYHDAEVDPLAAGRELGVDAVVAASFQRSGSRLRVTVQLLDTRDGRPLWGRKVTTSFDDVFDMQDEVSRQIAKALEVELTDRDQSRLGRAARSSAASEHYLEGRVHLLRQTVNDVHSAVECFERACAADPDFAPAWAGLADAYLHIAFTFEPEGGWYRRAEESAAKALALDPNLPEARYVRGRLLWTPQGGFKHADAIAELAAAVAARPGLNEAHTWLGIVLFHVSLLDQAASHFQRSLAINPQDEIAIMHLGFCRYLQGAFQPSLDISNDIRRRAASAWAFYQTALAEIQLGGRDAAERTIELAWRQFPGDILFYPVRGLAAALRGDAPGADEMIDMTVRNAKSFGHYHHAQYDVACIHAVLGRTDEALRWLSDAAHNGFPCYIFFERDPLLEPLRTDTRFDGLMRALRGECATYRRQYDIFQSSAQS